MRLRLLMGVTLSALGCESGPTSAIDRLCDPETGPWTRYEFARAQCVPEVERPSTYDLAYMEANCRQTYGAAIEAGTINVTTRSLREACLAALDANACQPGYRNDWTAIVEPACAGMTWGTVADGESCSMDEECDEGSYCDRESGCGVCARRRGIGDDCTRDAQCYLELCLDGACRRPANGFCRDDDDCDAGGQCVEGASPAGKGCMERLAVGEYCFASVAYCDSNEGYCSDTRCAAFATAAETCSSIHPCAWNEGLACVAGACTAMAVVGLGETCGRGFARCADPLECVDNTCTALGREGDACDDATPCDWYSVCVDGACTYTDFDEACLEPAADA